MAQVGRLGGGGPGLNEDGKGENQRSFYLMEKGKPKLGDST